MAAEISGVKPENVQHKNDGLNVSMSIVSFQLNCHTAKHYKGTFSTSYRM